MTLPNTKDQDTLQAVTVLLRHCEATLVSLAKRLSVPETLAKQIIHDRQLITEIGDNLETLLRPAEDRAPKLFRNFYECPECHATWDDVGECTCNDACPHCGLKDIQPYESKDA